MLFHLLALLQFVSCAWQVVWQDEFDYSGAPNSSKWGFEKESFHVNNEKQIYTNSNTNTFVSNGVLTIRVKKESHNGYQYTSGRIDTYGKGSWTYGKMEARMKLPKGRGVWPAFWMLGTSITDKGGSQPWAKCGEIDIMENVGKEANNIYGTIHYDTGSGHQQEGSKMEVSGPGNDFHVYAVEWDSSHIKHSVDGREYTNIDIGSHGGEIFRKPFYIILNHAIGGDWGGDIDDGNLPQDFIIDYVRVSQNK